MPVLALPCCSPTPVRTCCCTSLATATAPRCWCSSAARAPTSSTPRATPTSTGSRACSARSSATPSARRWARSPPGSCSSSPSRRSGARRTRPPIELAPKLADLMPGDLDHVFFTSGGSESVESAWKLVRQYHVASGEPQRTKAIARDVAYHGVTLGALALTGVPRYKEQFGSPAIPTIARVEHQRLPRARRRRRGRVLRAAAATSSRTSIQAEGPDTMAMIIAEPVQNAGGCLVPARRVLAGAARARRPPRDPARLRRGDLRLRARSGEWLGVRALRRRRPTSSRRRRA